jgi:hypothetical protein
MDADKDGEVSEFEFFMAMLSPTQTLALFDERSDNGDMDFETFSTYLTVNGVASANQESMWADLNVNGDATVSTTEIL